LLTISRSGSHRLWIWHPDIFPRSRPHPAKAELVKLRSFPGLTIAEASEILNFSEPTAKRHWTFARAWLQSEIKTMQKNH
jgi:hypothetical protein